MINSELHVQILPPQIGPEERVHELGGEFDVPVVNLLVLDMEVEGERNNIQAWLQGYPAIPEIAVKDVPNSVARHRELVGKGENITEHEEIQDEIYFPITGSLQVLRGESIHTLDGIFPNINTLRDQDTRYTMRYDGNEALLTYKNGDKEFTIAGFVIPGGVIHATSQADPDKETWWIAVKVKRDNPNYRGSS